jgi:hypothetical protein
MKDIKLIDSPSIFSIEKEEKTMSFASFKEYKIETFLITAKDIEDKWGYIITKHFEDNVLVDEDEVTMFSSSRIALITAICELLKKHH